LGGGRKIHRAVPGDLAVPRAQGNCDEAEAARKVVMQDGIVTVHVESENEVNHRGASWCNGGRTRPSMAARLPGMLIFHFNGCVIIPT